MFARDFNPWQTSVALRANSGAEQYCPPIIRSTGKAGRNRSESNVTSAPACPQADQVSVAGGSAGISAKLSSMARSSASRAANTAVSQVRRIS
jgi:hypothetical protein